MGMRMRMYQDREEASKDEEVPKAGGGQRRARMLFLHQERKRSEARNCAHSRCHAPGEEQKEGNTKVNEVQIDRWVRREGM